METNLVVVIIIILDLIVQLGGTDYNHSLLKPMTANDSLRVKALYVNLPECILPYLQTNCTLGNFRIMQTAVQVSKGFPIISAISQRQCSDLFLYNGRIYKQLFKMRSVSSGTNFKLIELNNKVFHPHSLK